MGLEDKEIIGVRGTAIGIFATALLTIFGGNYINKAHELGSFSKTNNYIKQEIKKDYQEFMKKDSVFHWGIG